MVFGDLNRSFAPRGLILSTKSKGGICRKLFTIEIMVHYVISTAINNTNLNVSLYFLLIYFHLLIHFFR